MFVSVSAEHLRIEMEPCLLCHGVDNVKCDDSYLHGLFFSRAGGPLRYRAGPPAFALRALFI